MNRINRSTIRMLIQHPANSAEHPAHRFSEILTSVSSDKYQLIAADPVELRMCIAFCYCMLHRVNNSVAGNINCIFLFSFTNQVCRRHCSRRKMILADYAHSLTVEFLRIRTVDIIGAKSRFHMTDGNLQIKTCQRSHKRSRCISVNQYNIGSNFFKRISDTFEYIYRNIKQRLLRLHNVQIVVRNHIERFQNLIQHLTVLCGNANRYLKRISSFQFLY